jgi:hypothetical protein
MDIRKELKKLNYNTKSIKDIVDDINFQHRELVKQQQELNKKKYLIQLIDIANKMEEAIEDLKFLVIQDLEWLEISCIESEYGHKVVFWLIDKDGEYISKKVPEQENFVKMLFEKIEDFNADFINEKNLCGECKLELKCGIGEKLLNFFLSDELRKVLDYNKINLELPNNNEPNKKKSKI